MPKKIYSFEISKSLYNKSFTLQFTLSIYAKREKMARLRRLRAGARLMASAVSGFRFHGLKPVSMAGAFKTLVKTKIRISKIIIFAP